MINTEMIKNKIARIQYDLSHLKEYAGLSLEEITKSYEKHKTTERIIEVVINEAIDINQHIIVEKGKGELPFDFKESFLLLVELKVYPKEFGEKVSQSVGLRNILVHEYRKLDEDIFYHSIKDCLDQYTQYCKYLIEYIS